VYGLIGGAVAVVLACLALEYSMMQEQKIRESKEYRYYSDPPRDLREVVS
jgi:hypothetical protein